MPVLLTDEWFAVVEQLTAEAGELNLPPALNNLGVNMIVNDDDHTTELSLAQGVLKKGLLEDAKTTLRIDRDTLRRVFLEFDMSYALQAFVTGAIKVEGDMSQLLALQTVRPSTEQKVLFGKILAQTTVE